MSRTVTTVRPHDPIRKAAALLIQRGITALPVIDRDDDLVAADVRHRLDIHGGPGRFTVTAHDGVVIITDERGDPADTHAARTLAASIPGVATVRVVTTPS